MAIEAHGPGDVPVRRRFHSTGSGASGRGDIAERMEELLADLAEGRDLIAEEEARDERPELN